MRSRSLDAVADRAHCRITRRLIPFVCLLYVIAFLDRLKVSFAGLEMTRGLVYTTLGDRVGAEPQAKPLPLCRPLFEVLTSVDKNPEWTRY